MIEERTRTTRGRDDRGTGLPCTSFFHWRVRALVDEFGTDRRRMLILLLLLVLVGTRSMLQVAPNSLGDGVVVQRAGDRPSVIAYLSQGPAASYRILADRLRDELPEETYVLFYHSFDHDCDGCLFQKGTSFAAGKNILIKALAKSQHWANIKYVVSFDDDAGLLYKQPAQEWFDSGWLPFHKLLLDEATTHPLIKPMYNEADTDCKEMGMHHGFSYQDCDDKDLWGAADTYQSCTDESMWAIRKDHLDFVYPHSTYRQDFFWANAMRIFYLTLRCYPAGFLVHHSFIVTNPQHRYSSRPTLDLLGTEESSTRGFPSDKIDLHTVAVEMLKESYPSLGPWWRMEGLDQRCDVQKMPSLGVHPTCKAATEERFQRWIAGKYHP